MSADLEDDSFLEPLTEAARKERKRFMTEYQRLLMCAKEKVSSDEVPF